MKKAILATAAIALGGIPIFLMAPAHSLPFTANPASFAKYLNQINWNDGKRRTFTGLASCREFTISATSTGYLCKHGYVKVSDPVRGTILCELQQMYQPDHFRGAAIQFYSGDIRHGNAYPCRNAS